MYYHGHLPRQMDVKDIHYQSVLVERHEHGLSLNGQLVTRVQRYPDGTIELATQASDAPERLVTYHFHGYQYWQILHDDEQPTSEYAGQIEAQLAWIQQICNNQYEDQPRSYAIGAIIDSKEHDTT